MATVTNWSPFGVALNITATAGTVTRVSASQYTVKINVSWQVYWDGASSNYGMKASAGGGSITLNPSGTYSSGNSGSFTGTFSVSGYGASTQNVTVTFTNFSTDWQGNVSSSSSKAVSFSVSVPAVPSYTVYYDANGGWGAPSSQTKYKDQNITISSTTPSRTGYIFQGWATSSNGGVSYSSGSTYSANSNVTLYAVWQAKTTTVTFYRNTSSSDTTSATQTFTYGVSGQAFSSKNWSWTGHSLIGWNSSSSATSAELSVTSSVSDSWIDSKYPSTKLYGVWKIDGAYLDLNIHYGNIIYSSSQTQMTEAQARAILTCDVYVNGSLVGDDVCDYYAMHTYGNSYEIKYNLVSSNHTVYSTSRLTGTIGTSTISADIYIGENHTVSYDANGGTGAPSSQTKKYGTTLTLSSTKPTRNKYTFIGWSTSQNSRKVSYMPSGKYNSESNITLYAVWIENYILFKKNGTIEVTELVEDGSTSTSTFLLAKTGILTVGEAIESNVGTIISKNRKVTTNEFIERQ